MLRAGGTPIASASRSTRRRAALAAAAALLAVGVLLCAAEGRENLRAADGAALAVAAACAAVGPVRRRIAAVLDRARHPSRAARWTTAGAIALAAAATFGGLARLQQRDLRPKWHDEFSYLIGARQLAHGRLWYPAHPCADFFDSFYVVARSVYASIYFPGTALLNAPAARFGWPAWVTPVATAAAAVALAYLLVTELLDGAGGIVAAVALAGLPVLAGFSVTVMSAVPMLLAAEAMVLAWLKWRAAPSVPRAALLGAVAGWAAITRPIDAAVFATPLLVATAVRRPRVRPGAAVVQVAVVLLCAAPFLAMQLALDRAVTGRALLTPHEAVTAREFPGVAYAFGHPPPPPPSSSAPAPSLLPQKRALYRLFYAPRLREAAGESRWFTYASQRLPWSLGAAAISPLLLLLLPAALLAPRRAWAVLAAFPLFFLAYAFYPVFLAHYALVLAPVLIVAAWAGAASLDRLTRGGANAPRRSAPVVEPALAVFVVVSAALSLHRQSTLRRGDFVAGSTLRSIDARLAAGVRPPAVVLFTFGPRDNPTDEPVYNPDVPWPDDAPVIRAHDLGPRNVELFGYYARTQPDRVFYRFDRTGQTVVRLGAAAELAGASPGNPPAPTQPTSR